LLLKLLFVVVVWLEQSDVPHFDQDAADAVKGPTKEDDYFFGWDNELHAAWRCLVVTGNAKKRKAVQNKEYTKEFLEDEGHLQGEG